MEKKSTVRFFPESLPNLEPRQQLQIFEHFYNNFIFAKHFVVLTLNVLAMDYSPFLHNNHRSNCVVALRLADASSVLIICAVNEGRELLEDMIEKRV